jgi:hypothetical protein
MLGLGNSLVVGAPISGFPCLKLDGTDDYINIAHHADLKPTAGITISTWVNLDTIHGATGWVNPDTDDNDDHTEVPIGTIASGGWMINLQYYGTANNPTTKIEFVIKVTDIGDGSSNYIRPIWGGISNTQVGATEHEIKDFEGWIHLACTYRAGVATLYINGSNDLNDGAVDTSATQVVNTGVSSGNDIVYAQNTQVMIGADAGHNTNNVPQDILRGGCMRETAIWSGGINAANVLEIYNGGLPGFDLTTNSGNYTTSAQIVGYWKLDVGADDSGNGDHNGNLNNSPSFVEI